MFILKWLMIIIWPIGHIYIISKGVCSVFMVRKKRYWFRPYWYTRGIRLMKFREALYLSMYAE